MQSVFRNFQVQRSEISLCGMSSRRAKKNENAEFVKQHGTDAYRNIPIFRSQGMERLYIMQGSRTRAPRKRITQDKI